MQPDLRRPKVGDRVLIHPDVLGPGSSVTEATVKKAIAGGVQATLDDGSWVYLADENFNIDPNSLK